MALGRKVRDLFQWTVLQLVANAKADYEKQSANNESVHDAIHYLLAAEKRREGKTHEIAKLLGEYKRYEADYLTRKAQTWFRDSPYDASALREGIESLNKAVNYCPEHGDAQSLRHKFRTSLGVIERYEEASEHAAAKRLHQALGALDREGGMPSDFSDGLALRARLRQEQEKVDAAIDDAARCLQEYRPTEAQRALARARALASDLDLDSLERRLSDLLRLEDLLRQAHASQESGDYDSAHDLAREAAGIDSLHPKIASIREAAVAALVAQRHLDASQAKKDRDLSAEIGHMRRIVELTPGDKDAVEALSGLEELSTLIQSDFGDGQRLYDARDYAEAVEKFRSVLSWQYAHAEASRLLELSEKIVRDAEGAFSAGEREFQDNRRPEDAVPHYRNAADLYSNRAQYASARDEAQSVLTSLQNAYTSATGHYEAGRLREAVEALDTIADTGYLYRDSAAELTDWRESLRQVEEDLLPSAREDFDAGRLTEALDTVAKALALYRASSDAKDLRDRIAAEQHVQRARKALLDGDLDTALTELQAAKELEPGHDEVKRLPELTAIRLEMDQEYDEGAREARVGNLEAGVRRLDTALAHGYKFRDASTLRDDIRRKIEEAAGAYQRGCDAFSEKKPEEALGLLSEACDLYSRKEEYSRKRDEVADFVRDVTRDYTAAQSQHKAGQLEDAIETMELVTGRGVMFRDAVSLLDGWQFDLARVQEELLPEATTALSQERFSDAYAVVSDALSLYPDLQSAQALLREVEEAQGIHGEISKVRALQAADDLRAAVKQIERLHEQYPDHGGIAAYRKELRDAIADRYFADAGRRSEARDIDAALQAIEHAIRYKKTFPAARDLQRELAGKVEAARERYQAAHRAMLSHEYPTAEEEIQAAIGINAQFSEAHSLLAQVRRRGDAWDKYQTAKSLVREEEYEAAGDILREVVEILPDVEEITALLERAHDNLAVKDTFRLVGRGVECVVIPMAPGAEVLLGRNTDRVMDSAVHYTSDAVSRTSQARIIRRDGSYFLEDLGGSNETRINGSSAKGKGPVKLSDGDKIGIHEVVRIDVKIRAREKQNAPSMTLTTQEVQHRYFKEDPKRVFVLVGEFVTLGRDPDDDVFLPDRSVSPHHAEIGWGEKGFWVRDAESRTVTNLNDAQVGRRQRGLRLGHKLTLGEMDLQLRDEERLPGMYEYEEEVAPHHAARRIQGFT